MTIRRSFAVVALVAAGIAALSVFAHRTSAQEPITCFDGPVTKIVPAGETYRIRRSSEVVLGLGNNTIHGSTGDDTICFADDSTNNVAFGSTGDDVIIILGATSVAHGGAGSDTIIGFLAASAFGDSGADSLNLSGDLEHAIRIAIADGGSGNDVILFHFVDRVIGGPGADGLNGFDANVIEGDSGNDWISTFSFEGLVDVNCGSGRDRLDGSQFDTVVSCETGIRS